MHVKQFRFRPTRYNLILSSGRDTCLIKMARSQLVLDLIERPRWGGRRRGAGRKSQLGARPSVPHRRRPPIAAMNPALVTLRAAISTLRRPDIFVAIRDDLCAARASHFQVVHFSVQGDHLHLLVEADNREALARGMHRLAIRIARTVNRVLCRRGHVFGDRYHARALTSPRAVRLALIYVLRNVRKHLRGVKGIDPCSSERWLETSDCRVVTIGGSSELAWRPRPRTWLLRVGWRRAGPITVDDAPKGGLLPQLALRACSGALSHWSSA